MTANATADTFIGTTKLKVRINRKKKNLINRKKTVKKVKETKRMRTIIRSDDEEKRKEVCI